MDHDYNKKRRFLTSLNYNTEERCENTVNDVMSTLNNIITSQNNIQEQLRQLRDVCERQSSNNMKNIEKMLTENLVLTRQTFKTTKRLFGENLTALEEEMGTMLPLSSHNDVEQLEAKLNCKENEDAMRTYIVSKKGSQSLQMLLRSCTDDNCLAAFNWDGRNGKRPLKNLKFFGKILNEAFSELNKRDFETQMRKAVEMSHNRLKQKNYKEKKSLNTTI